jgi:hypothetical protein
MKRSGCEAIINARVVTQNIVHGLSFVMRTRNERAFPVPRSETVPQTLVCFWGVDEGALCRVDFKRQRQTSSEVLHCKVLLTTDNCVEAFLRGKKKGRRDEDRRGGRSGGEENVAVRW